jgi:phospholipase C
MLDGMANPFKRLVVLMLENRSFDHMLGYLKSADYPIDGLDGDETNLPQGGEGPSIRVSPGARSISDLDPDPSHEFPNVNLQIFSNLAGEDTGQPKMQGFVQNYAKISGSASQGARIMKCFHGKSLPVLATLARQFAVCDRWFSSVPGSTIPNRLFACAATSGGSLTQDAVLAPAAAKTIFQIIDDPANPATFRIYTNGPSILMANLYLARHQNKFFDYSRFRDDCRQNLLPEFTFVEPAYDNDLRNGILATSQHPDFAVDAGEALISEVYSAIRDSPLWNDTLLLIVYDEHGGLFDHVTPPTLVRDPQFPDIPASKDFGFKFDRLGVRVPAVFVSPWLRAGTILRRQFDHCSIVATVRKLFCLDKASFNWREGQAATFEDIANLAAMRPDKPNLPNATASDGTIPLPRAVVLSDADRQAANAAMAAAGMAPAQRVADPNPITPDAAAVPTANGRKPAQLTLQIAEAVQNTLTKMGKKTAITADQIVNSQDAADFFGEAMALMGTTGARK